MRHNRSIFSAVAAFLAIALSGCSENAVAPDQGFVLSGSVSDVLTNEPVSQAEVVINSIMVTPLTQTTGDDGQYRFQISDSRVFGMQVNHPDYCLEEVKSFPIEADTQKDLDLGIDSLLAWDGWVRLDSIKVSCDDAPENYHYQYRCRLEDKVDFSPFEYIAFYFSAGYKFFYHSPNSIEGLGALLKIRFGNDHEIRYGGGHDYGHDLPRGNIDFESSDVTMMEAVIPGWEMKDFADDEGFGLDDIEVDSLFFLSAHKPCGSGEVEYGQTSLPFEIRGGVEVGE